MAAGRTAQQAAGSLYFLPLGGTDQIGMNMSLYGASPSVPSDSGAVPLDDQKWIIVDMGVSFADDYFPGVDILLPDPEFIVERRENLLAIVLTHAHEDHIGAVARLWPRLRCPVYATPFTAEMLRGRLGEAGLLDQVPLHVVPLGGEIDLDPFHLRYITVTHSILEPNALAITTAAGTLLHTGDFKCDPEPLIGELIDEASLTRLGDEGVLAMICDSTNIFRSGSSGSEATVRKNLIDLVGRQSGRVAVTTFASNAVRVASIAAAAEANGRHPVLVGRSMERVVSVARKCGYLKDLPELVSLPDSGYLPPDKVLYICTGSQGEPRGAMAQITRGEHRHVSLGAGDTVIFSSKIIPGNELSLARLHNGLAAAGVEVITENDAPIHVSGHPARDEVANMYSWVRPQISVPVHGDARHIEHHIEFAREMGVTESVAVSNGAMVRLSPGPATIVDHVHTGRLAVDGSCLLPEADIVLAQRRKIKATGHVVVTLAVDDDARLMAPVACSIQGVPAENGDGELVTDIDLCVADLLAKMKSADKRTDSTLAEAVRRKVRNLCQKAIGKKPIVQVQVIRIKESG